MMIHLSFSFVVCWGDDVGKPCWPSFQTLKTYSMIYEGYARPLYAVIMLPRLLLLLFSFSSVVAI